MSDDKLIEELKRTIEAQKAEIENLKTLKTLVDSIPGSIYWKDRQGRCLGRTRLAAEKMVLAGLENKVDPDAVIGKTDYDFHPKDIADQYRQNDIEVMETEKEMLIEETAQLPDGKIITQLSTKRPLYDEKGKVVGIIGNTVDITHQKEIEQELRIAKEKAEESSLVKQQFIDNIRHDLRTPASNIVAVLHAITDHELVVDKAAQSLLMDIRGEADRLMNYCERTVDFSEIYHGRKPIIHKPFPLRPLFNQISEFGKLAAKVKNLSFHEAYDERTLPNLVIGDPYRLEGILMQLVSNAVQYTDEGYIAFEMQPSNHDSKNIVISSKVQDTGIGIPEEKQDKIYEMFEKCKPSYWVFLRT